MTYQSEPNTNRRSNKIDDAFYTSWIVSAGVANRQHGRSPNIQGY
jgi:hypothetical protein